MSIIVFLLFQTQSQNNKMKHSNSTTTLLPDQLPSEPQEGNIEYKLKLVNPNHERFKRLVSQVCVIYCLYFIFLTNAYL